MDDSPDLVLVSFVNGTPKRGNWSALRRALEASGAVLYSEDENMLRVETEDGGSALFAGDELDSAIGHETAGNCEVWVDEPTPQLAAVLLQVAEAADLVMMLPPMRAIFIAESQCEHLPADVLREHGGGTAVAQLLAALDHK